MMCLKYFLHYIDQPIYPDAIACNLCSGMGVEMQSVPVRSSVSS
jgi:hypothetical protein